MGLAIVLGSRFASRDRAGFRFPCAPGAGPARLRRAVFLGAASVLLVAIGGCRQRPASKAGGDAGAPPSATCPAARELLDLGFVEPGSVHEATFVLANNRAGPLRIVKVRSDCDCLQPTGPASQSLATGSSIEFPVRFTAPKEVGPYSSRVIVVTDDPDRERIILSLRASVGLPLAVDPRVVELGPLAAGETRQARVLLVNHGRRPARALYGTAEDAACIAAIPPTPVEPGGSLPIVISVTAGSETPMARDVDVCIHTDCPGQSLVSLRVRYSVESVREGASSPRPSGQRREPAQP